MDPHATLGVPRTASEREISVAYRRLALEWHPDRNPHRRALAEETFKTINNAYHRLRDAGPPPPGTSGDPLWEALSAFCREQPSRAMRDALARALARMQASTAAVRARWACEAAEQVDRRALRAAEAGAWAALVPGRPAYPAKASLTAAERPGVERRGLHRAGRRREYVDYRDLDVERPLTEQAVRIFTALHLPLSRAAPLSATQAQALRELVGRFAADVRRPMGDVERAAVNRLAESAPGASLEWFYRRFGVVVRATASAAASPTARV